MAKPRIEANWVEIKPETLNGDAASLYNSYKVAYRIAKAMREKFENEMQELAGLPEGKRLVFGYNFGKLSVAVVDDDRKAKVAGKSAQTLSQFLAGQMASDNRA